jgi:hypothetical protein
VFPPLTGFTSSIPSPGGYGSNTIGSRVTPTMPASSPRNSPRSAEASRRHAHLKVLYTSGYTSNAVVHQGRLDEGAHLLAKPYRKEELVSKVCEVLSAGPDMN